MTQKILALFALLFVFSFFNAYADEPAPVLKPDVTENKAAPAPVPTPPASVSIPMPDVSGMVNITPRWSALDTTYTCPNGDVISTEGYVKKENEKADVYDARRFFLNDENVPYAVTLVEVIDRDKEFKELVKITAYFDLLDPSGNRDGVVDLVVEITDPRQKEKKLKGEDICTIARKTAAELVSTPAPVPAPKPPVADGEPVTTPDQKPKAE